MRVATVDGLVTLFYDGSKELFNYGLNMEWIEGRSDYHPYYLATNDNDEIGDEWEEWDLSDECKIYWKERFSWQQVIVIEGVTVIPIHTFHDCKNIKRVIFADTVVGIECGAFHRCFSLVHIKLSTNLEFIGYGAFEYCNLSSVFIPPRCRDIGTEAFACNRNLTIFSISQDTALGRNAINRAKLLQDSPFKLDIWGNCHNRSEEVHNWLKNINNDEKYSLHRACSSLQPLKEVLLTIVQAKGIGAFKVKNEAGITPAQYLQENPYADVDEMDIVRDYVMKMMGECN